MRGRFPQAALAAALALVCGQAQAAWLDRCTTARLVASWKHDGLWRTWQVHGRKTPDGHRLRYVGEVRAGGRTFRIYFDVNANPETATHHGHHDLVVTTAGGTFLGLYDISDLDAEPARTEGADILFPPRKDDSGQPYRDRIHFGPKGPPEEPPLLFGYDLAFSTPAEFRKYFPRFRPWPEPGPRIQAYCRRPRSDGR